MSHRAHEHDPRADFDRLARVYDESWHYTMGDLVGIRGTRRERTLRAGKGALTSVEARRVLLLAVADEALIVAGYSPAERALAIDGLLPDRSQEGGGYWNWLNSAPGRLDPADRGPRRPFSTCLVDGDVGGALDALRDLPDHRASHADQTVFDALDESWQAQASPARDNDDHGQALEQWRERRDAPEPYERARNARRGGGLRGVAAREGERAGRYTRGR